MNKILIVDDDEMQCALINRILVNYGFETIVVNDGKKALELLEKETLDLVITDLMMPHIDGIELIKKLREKGNNIPILMITAKNDFDFMQEGFIAGSDDYMLKPVNLNELVLRVNALIRRSSISKEGKQSVGSFILDYGTMTVSFRDKAEELPQKEFMIFNKLINNIGIVYSRKQLMDEIWGENSESDIRTIDVHINRLREKFYDNPEINILTVRGKGYKIEKTL